MYQTTSILIVEDDHILSRLMYDLLENTAQLVIAVTTCGQAYEEIVKCQFDVVILDRSLPDGDGLEIAAYLKDMGQPSRVLFLSSLKTQLAHKLEGYQAGCIDYACKPINSLELKSKVQALLIVQKSSKSTVLQFSDLSLYPSSGQLRLSDTTVKVLRRKETAILACLLRHRPNVVTKEQIIEHVWGLSENSPAYSTLDVYIRRLRIHLENKHQMIKTARGFGYYITEYID